MCNNLTQKQKNILFLYQNGISPKRHFRKIENFYFYC